MMIADAIKLSFRFKPFKILTLKITFLEFQQLA